MSDKHIEEQEKKRDATAAEEMGPQEDITEKPVTKSELASVSLLFRTDGHMECNLETVGVEDFVKQMDDWNPEYENTHTIATFVKMFEDYYHAMNEALTHFSGQAGKKEDS